MDATHKRSELRSGWTIDVRKQADHGRATTRGSVDARLRAVAELTADCWRLAQKPLPDYARCEAPIRVLPMRDTAAAAR